jgi:hypothetical protein
MKPLRTMSAVLSAVMILSVSAYADHGNNRGGRYVPSQHYNSHYNGHDGGNWVIPLVIGGVLGYALSEPRHESVTYVQSVSAPAPIIYAPQPMYQEQWVYFSDCDCQRKVLVPVR